MEKVSIVGLGWVGLPLAEKLQKDGYDVRGSKASTEGVEEAKALGLNCQLLNTTLDLSLRNPNIKALFSCDTLVITLPPNGHHGLKKYASIVAALAKTAEYCGAKRIVFTSSISVYGKQANIVTEQSYCEPINDSGDAVLAAEEALLAAVKIPVAIVRLGGLFGDDRLPQNWLQKKTHFDYPNHSINMVHRVDAVNAIAAIIAGDWNEKQIYNVVVAMHPTRYEYYNKVAVDHRLPLPIFDEAELARPTRASYVDGSKITRDFPFQYQGSIYEV